jgi:hypothetical protein
MTNKIYIVLALCLLAFSIKIKHEAVNNGIPGGWTPIDVNNLTKEQKSVDFFIRGS